MEYGDCDFAKFAFDEKRQEMIFRMKMWLICQYMNLCTWLNKVWYGLNEDMGVYQKGGSLPSLTDSQFLQREGYTQAIKDIHEWMNLGRNQEEQLAAIHIMEYLVKKGGIVYATKPSNQVTK